MFIISDLGVVLLMLLPEFFTAPGNKNRFWRSGKVKTRAERAGSSESAPRVFRYPVMETISFSGRLYTNDVKGMLVQVVSEK